MPEPAKRPARSATIVRMVEHNSDTRSLFLNPADRGFSFVPGHFISISIPLGDEVRSRPYTIASPVSRGLPFEICFNRVPNGRGVAWLFDRKVGDTIEFTGPYGTFTMSSATAAEIIFIAEGTAIAPIRPMIHQAMAAASRPPMTLLYAAASPDHILYRGEFEGFARDRGLRLETFVAPSHEIYERLRSEAERRWVNADSDRGRHFYICGVGKGVIAIRDLLRGAGYERRAVHYEQW